MKVTQERLKELVRYEPESGDFYWLDLRRKKSPVAGAKSQNYITIFIDSKSYRAHLLAWLYMTGEWPEPFIDHRDLNKHNNAWTNLRLATGSQNFANRGLLKTNKSGFKGVSLHSRGHAWIAQIKEDRKQTYLGSFSTREEAHAAYAEAASRIYGEFARTA